VDHAEESFDGPGTLVSFGALGNFRRITAGRKARSAGCWLAPLEDHAGSAAGVRDLVADRSRSTTADCRHPGEPGPGDDGWDNGFPFAPGTENFPANGLTLPHAPGYAEWLTKTTGQTYRVPDEEEVKALYQFSAGENTLDYWAGSAPLLKELGSFKPNGAEGEELVFHLGGNVTEWVLTKDGKGQTLGGSADRLADGEDSSSVDPMHRVGRAKK